jgi:maltodextrin utilization protein YvdJ
VALQGAGKEATQNSWFAFLIFSLFALPLAIAPVQKGFAKVSKFRIRKTRT